MLSESIMTLSFVWLNLNTKQTRKLVRQDVYDITCATLNATRPPLSVNLSISQRLYPRHQQSLNSSIVSSKTTLTTENV
jgi:hypothetical protein